MAMNKVTLAKAIVNEIYKDKTSPEEQKAKAQAQGLWEKIAGEIIAHIQTNAVVTVNAGIAVSTTSTPPVVIGATSSTGTGSIA